MTGMADGLTKLLKRWRDNYYVSQLLSYPAKPLRFVSSSIALQLQQKIRKNSVTIRLPNGKKMSIGETQGLELPPYSFGMDWMDLNPKLHGRSDSYSSVRRPLLMPEQTVVFTPYWLHSGIQILRSSPLNP